MGCQLLPPSPPSNSACLVESLCGKTCFLPKVTDAEAKIDNGLNLNLNKLTHSHLYQTSCWCGWPRGFGACTYFLSSLLNIYFHPSVFQSLPLLIYFCNSMNRCSHCTKVWHKTDLIGDARLSRLMWHSLTTLTEIAPKLPFLWHVWTEVLSCMISMV